MQSMYYIGLDVHKKSISYGARSPWEIEAISKLRQRARSLTQRGTALDQRATSCCICFPSTCLEHLRR